MKTLLSGLFLGAACAVLPLAAHAGLKTEVFVETSVVGADGVARTTRAPAARAVPGDQILYVLTFRNEAAKPAEGVTITNPVPQGLTFAGSGDEAAPLVSVDGRTFGPLDRLTVRKADGSSAPAAAGDVTQIRWTLPQAVPAGGEASFTFRATLK
ncbi:hypothetical protein AS593_00555 [Caulobacter vibrioides]|nr:hypothetical protein AS593_00555 [Caulobacter vibrioides]